MSTNRTSQTVDLTPEKALSDILASDRKPTEAETAALVEMARDAFQTETVSVGTVRSTTEQIAALTEARKAAQAAASKSGAIVARIAYVLTDRRAMTGKDFAAAMDVSESQVSRWRTLGKALTEINGPKIGARDAATFATLDAARNAQVGGSAALQRDVVRRLTEAAKAGDTLRPAEALAAAREDAEAGKRTERPKVKVSTVTARLSALSDRLSQVDAETAEAEDLRNLTDALGRLAEQVERLTQQASK